jgi:hypothetical protein
MVHDKRIQLRAGGLQEEMVTAGSFRLAGQDVPFIHLEDTVLLEQGFQSLPAPVEPDLDVFNADSQDFGDFLLTELADIRKDDDAAERLGQEVDQTEDTFAHLSLFQFFLGRGRLGRRRLPGDFFQGQVGDFPLLAEVILADVVGNPKKIQACSLAASLTLSRLLLILIKVSWTRSSATHSFLTVCRINFLTLR